MRTTWVSEDFELFVEADAPRAGLRLFLLFVAAVVFAAAVGLSVWWLWEFVINNPLPYTDPEARAAVGT